PSAALAVAFASTGVMFALRHWRYPWRFLPWALIGVACVTIAAVEIVFVVDDLSNSPWERMNTVFKFYLQAWLLLAVGCGVLLSRLLSGFDTRQFRVTRTTAIAGGAV